MTIKKTRIKQRFCWSVLHISCPCHDEGLRMDRWRQHWEEVVHPRNRMVQKGQCLCGDCNLLPERGGECHPPIPQACHSYLIMPCFICWYSANHFPSTVEEKNHTAFLIDLTALISFTFQCSLRFNCRPADPASHHQHSPRVLQDWGMPMAEAGYTPWEGDLGWFSEKVKWWQVSKTLNDKMDSHRVLIFS